MRAAICTLSRNHAQSDRATAWRAMVACCVFLGMHATANAAPQASLDTLRSQLTALDSSLSQGPATDRTLTEILSQHGLDNLSEAAPPRLSAHPDPRHRVFAGPAAVEVVDFRIALAILAQSYDGKDNGDVILAQGDRGSQALSFRGGVVTLNDIRSAAARLSRASGTQALTIPVVLWEDTLLRLVPGDDLVLSRAHGAFVMSFGRVEITGASLSVTEDANPLSSEFVPFLTVGGGGSLALRDSRVSGLGFGWTEKFSGLSVVSHPFMPSLGPSVIEGNVIEDIVTLVLSGTSDAHVTGNQFHNVRDNALRLTRAPRAQVAGNLFHGEAPTNAIRLLDRSNDAHLAGNVFLGGTRAAILVRGGSDRVQVAGNLLWRRDGAAIKFLNTACGRASGNIALDGRQKGIEVRKSPGTVLSGNTIGGVHSSGIWISDQPDGAVTRLSDNVLVRNGSGLATATAARIVLDGNDLSQQLPRLVDGDLNPQNAVLIADLRGQTPLTLTAGGTGPMPFAQAGPCQTEDRR